MIAAVSIGLRMRNIIPLLYDHQIRLSLQNSRHIIDVLHKIADHPYAGNILKTIFCIENAVLQPHALQLLLNAPLLLNSALGIVNRAQRPLVPVQAMV